MASRRDAQRAENRFFGQFNKGPKKRPKANVAPRFRGAKAKGGKSKAGGGGG